MGPVQLLKDKERKRQEKNSIRRDSNPQPLNLVGCAQPLPKYKNIIINHRWRPQKTFDWYLTMLGFKPMPAAPLALKSFSIGKLWSLLLLKVGKLVHSDWLDSIDSIKFKITFFRFVFDESGFETSFGTGFGSGSELELMASLASFFSSFWAFLASASSAAFFSIKKIVLLGLIGLDLT